VNLIALRCSGPIGLCSFVAIRRRQRGQITTGSFGRELVGLKHERRAQCDAGFHAYQMLEADVRQFAEWSNRPPRPDRRRPLSGRSFADRACGVRGRADAAGRALSARPPVSPRHPRETPSHLPPAHHSPRVAPPIGV